MKALWAAALLAACHHQRSTPPAGPSAPAPAPDAGPRAESYETITSIASAEDAALHSADPAPLLLKAARLRRERMARAALEPAMDPAEVARAQEGDAQACAADARRSWSAQFPAAAANAEERPPSEVAAQVGPAGAEALYLEAVCAAAWARLQGFTPLIARRLELTAALLRVAELAPDLDGAGPDRELGALLAALPAYAGGDLVQAGKHLEAAVQRAPADPRNRLVLARTVAVKAQDRALFEEQLRAVAAGSDAAAAGEAAALLQRESDLFGQ